METLTEVMKLTGFAALLWAITASLTGCGITSGQTGIGVGESFFKAHNEKLKIIDMLEREEARHAAIK